MKDIFLTLNKVQSHLIIWGEPFNCGGADVIICVSGNPGITDFYRDFASFLHERTNLPVCVVGQAGHEEVPDKHSNQLKSQENLFNLEGQIQHKLDLFDKHIDKESKLHLVGHSIGSWLILQSIEKNKNMIQRISSINLLFPTVQRMAESKNGRFMNHFIRKLYAFIMLLFTLLEIIPESIKNILVYYYLKLSSIPLHYRESVLKFIRYNVAEKVLFLAFDEMDKVTTFNNEVIEMVKDKTNVMYSTRDGWAPVHYMEDFKKFEPNLKMKEVNNIDHAFVLNSSGTVAEVVSEFIKTKM